MFLWAVIFLLLSIVLGLTAFSGVAIAISFFSKILFLAALILLLLSLILFVYERRKKIIDRPL
jgi:uncharacterized membrane protein YtjA (UPF0391 family)